MTNMFEENVKTAAKAAWVRPQVRTIKAGSAEAAPGTDDDLQSAQTS